MKRAAVIGHPVAHSKSPLIHGFWLEQLGIDGCYDRIDVAPDDLAAFVQALPASGLSGVNVTLPHKVAAAQLCDRLTPQAERIGATNTLVVQADGRLLGHNTDVEGFAEPLARRKNLQGRIAIVLGAGGAARAIVAGLADMGVTEIRIVNRTFSSIAALAPVAGAVPLVPHGWDSAAAALAGAAVLVNTTSLGMTGQPPLELALDGLAADAIVNDIVYAPLDTALLARARARGLVTIDGLEMLVGQAAAAFALFFGAAPDRAGDAQLRARLLA